LLLLLLLLLLWCTTLNTTTWLSIAVRIGRRLLCASRAKILLSVWVRGKVCKACVSCFAISSKGSLKLVSIRALNSTLYFLRWFVLYFYPLSLWAFGVLVRSLLCALLLLLLLLGCSRMTFLSFCCRRVRTRSFWTCRCLCVFSRGLRCSAKRCCVSLDSDCASGVARTADIFVIVPFIRLFGCNITCLISCR
jgi:hypothetical protein